ncbi:cilia- and flagella-associated protein 65-like [Cydia strobilella]|uniref:cilia- and flagella-associated protein 65-like n=1 Tax=Cydia strobilella TaxID=1100964 RepID=UPI003007A674
MEVLSDESICEIKELDFGSVPVDTVVEKSVWVENTSNEPLTYRVALIYVINTIDQVFNLSVTSAPVKPRESVEVLARFRPKVPGQSYTDYYMVDDTAGNTYRFTVFGKSIGSDVTLSEKKLTFKICKKVLEQRKAVVNIINRSAVETTYQWLLPLSGQGYFQISTGNCGLIRAYETIMTTVLFSGTALGVYTAELALLVLHQAPQFLNMISTIFLPGNPMFTMANHVFEKNIKRKNRYVHLMENSLNRLSYIPSASVFDKYLDFGVGSVSDVTRNISQTLCLTNHEEQDGYIQWIPDPDNIFLIDPIESIIPAKESRLFTVRFRPIVEAEVYGYLMCGDFQYESYDKDIQDVKIKHTWFRISCIGNTWSHCTEWATEWDCPTELILQPTVPNRTTYGNFMLSNRLETAMYFKIEAPEGTNFVVMPMCGVVQGRGWQIISVALEPKTLGNFYETWDLRINRCHKAYIRLTGSAESSEIELMSHGYNPDTHAVYEFPPTITGCTNYTTAYFHNVTRMSIHVRILNPVPWLGADDGGSIVIPPKAILCYHWWFFPKEANKVYKTTITCSCVVLINGRPIAEPKEIFIQITGFSELPDLRVLPKLNNLHDIVVKERVTRTITIYNYCSCFFTSKLYYTIDGMDDDWSGDRMEIDSEINSLKPSNHCEVKLTVTPDGAGPRQISISYTVLYRNEFDQIEEIQPVTKTICIVWYDGIYPSIKIKRTISVKCPVILSNHCVWNITNVDEFNKALMDCRPNEPLTVNLHAPDLCVRPGEVELIFVIGCIYDVPVAWSLRREKICDCAMIEVQRGISTYEWRHHCVHRSLVELTPSNGIVSTGNPALLHLKFNYTYEGLNTLCYVLTLPNQRSLYLYIHVFANVITKGILTPLRRPAVDTNDYLAVLECGKVPINNLDPVIRIIWFYNPTEVFTTWRLLRGNTTSQDSVIKCLLYFAEVPPLGKLAIPFAFMPTEMVDYEAAFSCSFGYDTVKILVKGQGGLPNCVETRLDIPLHVEKFIRAAYRREVVFLSLEHRTIPIMPTHSLTRDTLAICNDTDHIIRFIWLPERIANIVNVVMTPCWGVIQPKSSEWITMTVYTLQEPATFTTTVACELLDLTERRRYQQNELLRKNKTEKCNQEFIITEEGYFRPGINDEPPYVLDIEKPQPFYLSLTISISSKGQRDGFPRMLLKQQWEQTPPYDLLTSELHDYYQKGSSGNSMTTLDIIRIIDGILWDALHSKMFKNQIEYYAKEDIPTYSHLMNAIESKEKSNLSRRVTSGICDAIVNKAIYHVYNLNPKHEISIFEAE